jgi:hypothetical protein
MFCSAPSGYASRRENFIARPPTLSTSNQVLAKVPASQGTSVAPNALIAAQVSSVEGV